MKEVALLKDVAARWHQPEGVHTLKGTKALHCPPWGARDVTAAIGFKGSD